MPQNNNKQKFESNWISKTLETLEKKSWGEVPKDESYLVKTCYGLRKKKLKKFDIEDLRIMIGQQIGLKYLIPIALEALENNILAEGDFYEGDLLKSVVTSDKDYWKKEVENWERMCAIFNDSLIVINEKAKSEGTIKEIIKAFNDFEKIN